MRNIYAAQDARVCFVDYNVNRCMSEKYVNKS